MKKYFHTITKDQLWSWLFGVGIICLAFDAGKHSWTSNIYYVGIFLSVLSVVMILFDKNYRSRLKLGSKWVYIPLIIICVSVILSRVFQGNLQTAFSAIVIALLLFGAYLVAGILGKEIYKPFYLFVIVEALSVIIIALAFGNPKSGGLISIENYNIAVGFLIFGSIVAMVEKRWLIVIIGVIGAYFTGAEEALVAIVFLFIVLLVRRDFSKPFWITVGAVAVVIILGFFPFSYTRMLYAYPIDKLSMILYGTHSPLVAQYFVHNPDAFSNMEDYLFSGRFDLISQAFTTLKPFGNGYTMLVGFDVPHNIPMIIVYQIGILGAIAWVFLTFYGWIKTSWKYAFAVIVACSLFDHYFWTQLGIFWFALMGVATNEKIDDHIFKENIYGRKIN